MKRGPIPGVNIAHNTASRGYRGGELGTPAPVGRPLNIAHNTLPQVFARMGLLPPMGKESISWLPNTYPKNGMVFEARFARKDCTPCPSRSQCTRSKQEPRIIGLLPREQHEALQATRREQETEEFRSRYAARAGIEGTHEQAIRRCGLTAVSLYRGGEGAPSAPPDGGGDQPGAAQ